MTTIIGKVSATEKNPSTIDEFFFWTDKRQILSPFDIVKVEHECNSTTYGVIEEMSRSKPMYDGLPYLCLWSYSCSAILPSCWVVPRKTFVLAAGSSSPSFYNNNKIIIITLCLF